MSSYEYYASIRNVSNGLWVKNVEKNKLDYTKNEDQRMTILDVEYAVRTMELLDRWFPGCHELVEDFG